MRKFIGFAVVVALLAMPVSAKAAELEGTQKAVHEVVAGSLVVGESLVRVYLPGSVFGACESSFIGGIGLAILTGSYIEHRSEVRLKQEGLYRFNRMAPQVGAESEYRKWEKDPDHAGWMRLRGYATQAGEPAPPAPVSTPKKWRAPEGGPGFMQRIG